MIKSPVGTALAVGALLLALSPEARKTARKMAVKGTEMILDAADQVKAAASGKRTTGGTRKS